MPGPMRGMVSEPVGSHGRQRTNYARREKRCEIVFFVVRDKNFGSVLKNLASEDLFFLGYLPQ
jgi:hypothetical protein